MTTFQNVYNFDNINDTNITDWVFKYNGVTHTLATRGTRKSWCWCNTKTPSSGTGPSGPESGAGYIYNETSAPVGANDIFSMELANPINSSMSDVTFSFYYLANTRGNEARLTVDVFDGVDWRLEFDNIVSGSDNSQSAWTLVTLDLSNYNNIDMYIKISIDVLSSGAFWRKDIGIDTITINSVDIIYDDVQNFLINYNVMIVDTIKKVFDATNLTLTDFYLMVDDLKNNINTLDTTNYPHGVILKHTDSVALVKKDLL